MADGRVARRLAAVLAADVAGYSRLMGVDEEGTLAALRASRRQVIDPKIAEHRGRIVKTTGDGALVEFVSAVDAMRCAMEIQRAMAEHNAHIPEDRRIEFRIGINIGDVIVEEGDIYGDGVNIAARVEALAEPGAICLSDAAYQQIRGKLALEVNDMGEQQLKNIAQPVRVYGVLSDSAPAQPMLPLPDKPSIAVLPFTNMSRDPDQEYFADGIVEDIITALSRFSSLFVIARNSTFTYKGRAVDAKKVGRELGVRYVLEGSVRRSGERLRVTVQLINADSGAHIWADTYNRTMADLFDVQDDITQRTAGAIEPSIKQAEIERARRKRPEKLEAYDLYLRALPRLYSANREGNEEAYQLLKQSLTADPNFADAATALGTCLLWRIPNDWATAAEVGAELTRYFQQALQLDKENSDALAWSARAAAPIERKYSEAMILAERAVAANPNSAVAWTNRGWVCVFAEEPAAALPHLERAIRLSPLDPFAWDTWVGIAIAHVQLGGDEEAIAAARRAVNQNRHHAWAHRVLAISLALAGKREEAAAAMKEAMEVDPTFSISGFQKWNPFIHGNKRYVEGMRLAGFPV